MFKNEEHLSLYFLKIDLSTEICIAIHDKRNYDKYL